MEQFSHLHEGTTSTGKRLDNRELFHAKVVHFFIISFAFQ